MIILRIIIDVLFVIGIFFIICGIVGMLRMPDTFCRLQASTNIATMGALPIAVACAIYGFSIGNASIGVKSLLVGFFLLITNPIASHAMARAAYKSGAMKCKETICDHYAEVGNDE